MDDREVPAARFEESRGATAVAVTFSSCAHAAQLALIDGAAGLVWAPGGQVRAAFAFEIVDGRIVAIDLIADPERLGALDMALLD